MPEIAGEQDVEWLAVCCKVRLYEDHLAPDAASHPCST
jgi:hypothetical protein